jgi:hypothetical protein
MLGYSLWVTGPLMEGEQICMKTGQKVLTLLPIVLSILAVGLEGISGDLEFLRRVVVVLTLGSILWSIYNLLKEPAKPKTIILTTITAVLSLVLLIGTVSQTGW